MTADPRELLDQLDEAHRVWKEGGLGAATVALFTFPEAIPQLAAALRAVLDLADECERRGRNAQDHVPELRLAGRAYAGTATRIRSAVTTALTPGADTAGTHHHQNGEQS